MKIKIIGILLMMLLMFATVLPVAETIDNIGFYPHETGIGKLSQGEYEVEVIGNFLGYWVNVRNLDRGTINSNESLSITINTSTNPSWRILIGRTLELEPPIPDESNTYHTGPLFGFGQALITVEALLVTGDDKYWNSAEIEGFVFLPFIIFDDISFTIPPPT